VLGSDISARVDAMVTMAPFAARNRRSAARANRKVAVRLVSRTLRHSVSVIRRKGLRTMMPAFDTSASRRLNLSVTAPTARRTVSSSVTSPSIRTTLRTTRL